MRLAIASNVGGAAWAGSEELWFEAANALLGEGGSVSAVLHPQIAAGSRCRYLSKRGAHIRSWKRASFPALEGPRQLFAPSLTSGLLGKPDVVLVSCGSLPGLTYVPGLASFLLRSPVPYVVLCQFNADTLQFTPAERSRLREVCRRAARCVFVSRHNLELARVQLALPLTDAVVVPNPIRVRLDQPLALTGKSEVVRFANVARFHTVWKGQQNLLSLLAEPPWRDRPWELSFYGEGPDQEQLQQFASVLGLEQRIFFRGYVREVEQIWRTNDALLLPSVGEGMSLAMIEAMMCGRPVVANNVGGVSECLVDGKSGYVSGGTSKNDFALALERAWNSRDKWEFAGSEAHRRARELAAFEPGRALLGILRDCAEGRSAADHGNPLRDFHKI